MSRVDLDDTDRTLIACLQLDARIPSRLLASKAGISGTECVRRVRRLEASGVIRSYVTLIDPQALGLKLVALVRVRLDRQTIDRIRAFEAAIHQRSEVLQCWQLSGSWDFELLVVTADISTLETFQRECFGNLGVVAVNVSVVVRQAKHRTDFNVLTNDEADPRLLVPPASAFYVLFVRDDRSRVVTRRP